MDTSQSDNMEEEQERQVMEQSTGEVDSQPEESSWGRWKEQLAIGPYSEKQEKLRIFLPPLLAHRRESSQTALIADDTDLEYEPPDSYEIQDFGICESCNNPRKMTMSRHELECSENPEELFCCKVAQNVWEEFLEEEDALYEAERACKIDVDPHGPYTGQDENMMEDQCLDPRFDRLGSTASLLSRRRDSKRGSRLDSQSSLFSKDVVPDNTISFTLSNPMWAVHREDSDAQLYDDHLDIFTSVGSETDIKRKDVLRKFYPDGQPFLTIFPDGSGHVFYPSGNIAISISIIDSVSFVYIVLEDNRSNPRMKAIFMSNGKATCYHANGNIWVNLTQIGGSCSSENGEFTRRWSWLSLSNCQILQHYLQPIFITLGLYISVRIFSQDRIYLTFSYYRNIARFNVGAKLKLDRPEDLSLAKPNVTHKQLELKRLEIYSLVQRMQNFVKYAYSPHCQRIEPHHSLLAQIQRLKTQLEKISSFGNTKETNLNVLM